MKQEDLGEMEKIKILGLDFQIIEIIGIIMMIGIVKKKEIMMVDVEMKLKRDEKRKKDEDINIEEVRRFRKIMMKKF